MKKNVTAVVRLIKSALSGESFSIPDDISWDNIYILSNAHRITPLIYYGIKNCNIELPPDILEKFKLSLFKSTMLSAENEYKISKMFEAFNKKGIDYMPLKGFVVRDYYPRPEMRIVGDFDILIHPGHIESAAKELTLLGYTFEKESSHEYVFQSGNTKIELHKKMIGTTFPEYYDYYNDTERFFSKENPSHLCKLSHEDLYVYLVVHIAKHYRNGGIGLRHFTDLYVMERSVQLDKVYIRNELAKMALGDFYKNVEKLFGVWFDGKDFDEISKFMTIRIFESGIFGNHNNKVRASALYNNDKRFPRIYKLFHGIFLPLAQMKSFYPLLDKAPVLLPVFWLIRIFDRLLFKRNRIKRFTNDLKLTTQAKEFSLELSQVGFHTTDN